MGAAKGKKMERLTQFYIDGAWVAPASAQTMAVINPATEQSVGQLALGDAEDTDRAVQAAAKAFETWGQSRPETRKAYLRHLCKVYERRLDEMAEAIRIEMGAPKDFARSPQADSALSTFAGMAEAMSAIAWAAPVLPDQPDSFVVREPIGVCALITPWNWPILQVAMKVGAAIAAGCTMVLKPSELSPLSAILLTEMIDEIGLPAGVFNLVQGDGPGVGTALCQHDLVDMVSFTGSTRAGRLIGAAGAQSIKRVALELGGKSPNIVFADVDTDEAVTRGANHVFDNTGQSCDSPTKMLVERAAYPAAIAAAKAAAEARQSGDPTQPGNHLGPLVSRVQYDKVQALVAKALDQGARLIAGGLGKPPGFEQGYFVRATVLADVRPDMEIWRAEIFGPVLTLTPFEDEAEAIALANDTEYGLAGNVQSADLERARRVACRLRAGYITLNGNWPGPAAPFGGYKQSGNGREGGLIGIEDFLEIKAIGGWTGESAHGGLWMPS